MWGARETGEGIGTGHGKTTGAGYKCERRKLSTTIGEMFSP